MAGRVFAVPVLNRWLVHAPLRRVSALANRAAVEDLARAGPSQLSAELRGPEEPEPRPRTGPLDPAFLGLIPTRACNLACVYCGFGATPGAPRMDPRLACAGVDWMAEHAARTGRGTLDIHFFGGEPLVAPDVVDAVVERAKAQAAEKGLQPRLEISTNGACGEARAAFVGGNFQIAVLSFDGFAAVHDRHRPLGPDRGSFDQVSRTARILSRSNAALCLRVCVAEDNVAELPETVDWFCKEFRPSTIDFEALQPTPESERAGLRPAGAFVFAERLWKAWQVAIGHGVAPVYAAAETGRPRITLCPVGEDALIVQPDGVVSACYLLERDWRARGLDLNLGRLHPDGTLDVNLDAVERVRRLVAEKPRCESCFCRWSCAGGCHVSHSYPGCPARYGDACVRTRLVTAGSLLAGMGQEKLAEALLADRAAMERLALWPDDRLENRRTAEGSEQAFGTCAEGV